MFTPPLTRVATIHAILAMAYYQSGQPLNARAEFAQSREIIEAKLSDGLEPGNGGQGYWFDWDLARILKDEAARVLGDDQATLPPHQALPVQLSR
jgi:hypothetical protein